MNIWQVVYWNDGNQDSSFYKTVLINTKPVAIQIDKEEYARLAEHLRPSEIIQMKTDKARDSETLEMHN